MLNQIQGYDSSLLPEGVRSNFADNSNGLRVHYLEAGYGSGDRPCLLLLHGFPEIAYSWRKIMPSLAAAGYHVVAPDMRGYGRTTGWSEGFEVDLREFSMLNIVRDAVGLLYAIGHKSVAAVIGHDYGSPAAAWCATVRPDVFKRLVMMSAPFGGAPDLPFDTQTSPVTPNSASITINDQLALLSEPRKHYQWYYSTPSANENMWHASQGLRSFLRAYYHHKSADWLDNKPYRLTAWTAEELAKLPTYYIMDLHKGMAETVADEMPSQLQIQECEWLSEEELSVYVGEYQRTGFQGGLNWYRCGTENIELNALQTFADRRIEVPSLFLSGASDWGTYQRPHFAERMRNEICTNMVGFHLIEGAGHWVQQEQHAAVSEYLLEFLRETQSDRNANANSRVSQ